MLQSEQLAFEPSQGPELICAVGPDGKFTAEAPDYSGRWVKEADKDISRELRRRGLLFHQEQYLHEYPFCWRADEDPLIQYPRKSWFVRTTDFREQLLRNNAEINWLPEHIRDGRFGNFLESNVDWALSRERYWGTPLPIWVCEATGHMEAVASYDELLAKNRRARDRSLGRCQGEESAAFRASESSQALHRRGDVCLAQGSGQADAPRQRSDRLLVRLRRDALRPVGLATPGSRAIPATVPGRFHQRSHRSDPRLVLQPTGDQHAAVRSRERTAARRRIRIATFRIRSATASCWG